MKQLIRLGSLLALLVVQFISLMGCHREDVTPTASFTVGYEDPQLSTYLYQSKILTYVSLKATDKSTDAVSYQWNFGNGLISAAKEPVFQYEKSGTYTVTLTTTSRTGGQQTSTQTVTVLDRVLRRITIPYLRWNALGDIPNWPETKTADVGLTVGYRKSTDAWTAPGQVVFESPKVERVTTISPNVVVPVGQRIVIEPFSAISGLGVNLYGYDGSGRTLLFSSAASGGGFSSYTDGKTGQYVLRTGLGGTIIQLECEYE